METWKDVIGFEGYYKVSNKGRVKSFHSNKIKILKDSEAFGLYTDKKETKISKERLLHCVKYNIPVKSNKRRHANRHIKPSIKVQSIIDLACDLYGLTEDQIQSNSCKREISECRQLIQYVCAEKKIHTKTDIMAMVGGRSSFSFSNSWKVINNLLSYDKDTIEKYNKLTDNLKIMTDKNGQLITDGCTISCNIGTKHQISDKIKIIDTELYWSDGDKVTNSELTNINNYWVITKK